MSTIRPNSLAIVRTDSSVLAAQGTDLSTGKIFFRLLGGGIEFGEHSLEALKREFLEELNATTVNEEFLGVIENIFEFNSKIGHEITFLYQAELSDKSLYQEKMLAILDNDNIHAEWVPIDKIKSGELILYPIEAAKYL